MADDQKQDNTVAITKQKIVICGAGNAAHVFLGLSVQDQTNDVYLFSSFQTEAADFKQKIIANNNKLILERKQEKDKIEATINPNNITNDASCLQNADIIIISLPAFAHSGYLRDIAQHLGNKKCLIGVFPGASGLECDYQHIIKNKSSCKFGDKYTLLSCITLPWACRIKEFGQSVEILGTKTSVRICLYPKSDISYMNKFSSIIGNLPALVDYGHLINMSLGATNAIIHPSILYDKWAKWDNKPLDAKPLFYQGITQNGAKLLTSLSEETILVSNCIKAETNVSTIKCRHIYDAYKLTYGDKCSDTSSLYGIISTNPGYDGLTHPMIEYNDDDDAKAQYIPNFKHRYLSEDIPYGLIVIKGISLLLTNKPDTPNIDKVIQWAQKVMGKEYLIYDNNGNVKAGKDINQTRAPQKYNFKDIKQLVL